MLSQRIFACGLRNCTGDPKQWFLHGNIALCERLARLVRAARTRGCKRPAWPWISGDFVLIGTEVSPVLKTLRDNGIEVTALHSHMIDEQPRLYFMHFWANDDAQKLAQGLKAALDLVNSKKS